MRRLVFVAVALATVLLPASPAAAHGSGGSDDATNFESRVTASPHRGELHWEVIAGDALLELRNDSGRQVIIEGYSEEPYLRFDAEGGVFENRRSPAVYLNEDRYAQATVPADVDPGADPVWRRVAGGRTHAWHDHRIHWMSREKPPQVLARPGETVEVQRWAVPYRLAGAEAEVRGVLRYVPPDPWWPWLLGAAVALAVPAVAAVGLARGRLSLRRLTRTGAVLLAVLAVADAIHLWDDLVAVPATVRENIGAGLYGGVFLVGASVAAVAAWRALQSGFALVFGGLALLYGFGVSHLGQVGSSQLATVLPEAFTRAVVAANIGIAAPIAILVVVAERRFPARRDRPSSPEVA